MNVGVKVVRLKTLFFINKPKNLSDVEGLVDNSYRFQTFLNLYLVSSSD